ncbi:MAG: GNAT family N-acetyltransferase [Acidobacteriota bacterium]
MSTLHSLERSRHLVARDLFGELVDLHLSLDAVLHDKAPGEVRVDHPAQPSVAFVSSAEGQYLAGDPSREELHLALREALPKAAYLITSEAWAEVFDAIWSNPIPRPHAREIWRHDALDTIGDGEVLPEGLELRPVDEALLNDTSLGGRDRILDWVESWRSTAEFQERGFGRVLVRDGLVVSWSLADCVLSQRAEIGVGTRVEHRRTGLGRRVVRANLQAARERGVKTVGWHCLSSNRGSIRLAESLGFERRGQYLAYSAHLPAENVEDLSIGECRDWAEHHESAREGWPAQAFHAAGAWSLAGEKDKALANLEWLLKRRWPLRPEWVEDNWKFASLLDDPDLTALVDRVRVPTSSS